MSKFNAAKFNRTVATLTGRSPITTERTPSGVTFEGGPGFARDRKSELFLLAVANMVGEATFYESAATRDTRYAELVRANTLADPQWTADLLRWLRGEGNMRSASLVGAAEFVKARLGAGEAGMSRQVVDSVLQRADEPGELLAYWMAQYGRAVPKPVKRGLGDAAARMYSERNLLKYDTVSHGFRFGDVLDLVHASPDAGKPWQGDLFRYALNRRHDHGDDVPASLRMVAANRSMRVAVAENPVAALTDQDALARAGMTWEDVLSLAGPSVDKAELWAAIIPSMGYMALLRNLRNFDEAGVSDGVVASVLAKLADPGEVARSRQFPFRFLSAYEAAPSLRWGPALEKALNLSLANLPKLGGRSLILVDTSASMTSMTMSARSKMSPAKAAAVFGVALAAKGEDVDLHGFADGVFRHRVGKGASVLREIAAFTKRTGEVGHGTAIAQSLRATYKKHDRVFLISDMQTIGGGQGGGVSEAVPAHVPIYGFNLGGYQRAAMATGSGNRHEFGGLTDAAFRMVPLLEAGRAGTWPWQ